MHLAKIRAGRAPRVERAREQRASKCRAAAQERHTDKEEDRKKRASARDVARSLGLPGNGFVRACVCAHVLGGNICRNDGCIGIYRV